MMGDKVAVKHISSMKGCTNADIDKLTLAKDQEWAVKGNYDFTKHDGNLEGGKQSDVSCSFCGFGVTGDANDACV